MRIIFLRAYDFPFGGAPQNRLLGICKGLVEQGHNIEVHQYTPAKLNIAQNHIKFQIYKSVKIYNHAWKWSPIKTKFMQIYGITIGIMNTMIAISKSRKHNPIDYFFINSASNLYIFLFFLLTKFCKAKLGRDLNEYPLTVLSPNKYNSIQKVIKRHTNYQWFDVLFVITKELERYYRPFTKTNADFLYLPVTVDFDRFPEPVQRLEEKFITYCGDLSQSKDGVLFLLRSFAKIKDDYPKLDLKLIGQNRNPEYLKSLNDLISELKLSDRVTQTGFIHPEKIPAELYQSRLLVLSRPKNIQSQGGFPTKLAEYLATGIPVAVTSVGELPLFLKDEQNAFLATPDDVDSFAFAMRRALKDDEFALKVGLAGRKIALKYFSHEVQGKIISEFLNQRVR